MSYTRVAVYRKLPSDGARALVESLRGQGVDAFRVRQWRKRDGVLTVCWGQAAEAVPGVLNAKRLGDKLEELKLLAKGLPDNSVEFIPPDAIMTTEVGSIGTRWWGRKKYHQSAYDLRETVHGARDPDFFVRKLTISAEYRVHVFLDKAIRVGKKQPDPDELRSHDWIRSLETGWIINYGKSWRGADEQRMPALRKIARLAVKAVGYDFGAVDLGVENGTGRIVVFEVNQAPALLNANTALAYAKAIQKAMV